MLGRDTVCRKRVSHLQGRAGGNEKGGLSAPLRPQGARSPPEDIFSKRKLLFGDQTPRRETQHQKQDHPKAEEAHMLCGIDQMRLEWPL